MIAGEIERIHKYAQDNFGIQDWREIYKRLHIQTTEPQTFSICFILMMVAQHMSMTEAVNLLPKISYPKAVYYLSMGYALYDSNSFFKQICDNYGINGSN